MKPPIVKVKMYCGWGRGWGIGQYAVNGRKVIRSDLYHDRRACLKMARRIAKQLNVPLYVTDEQGKQKPDRS